MANTRRACSPKITVALYRYQESWLYISLRHISISFLYTVSLSSLFLSLSLFLSVRFLSHTASKRQPRIKPSRFPARFSALKHAKLVACWNIAAVDCILLAILAQSQNGRYQLESRMITFPCFVPYYDSLKSHGNENNFQKESASKVIYTTSTLSDRYNQQQRTQRCCLPPYP